MVETQIPRRRRWWIAPLVILLLLAGAGAGGALYYKRWEKRRQLYRFGPIVMPERTAKVPHTWDVDTLAARLQKSNKIHDADAFEEVAAKIGLKSVEAGVYRLPAQASPEDLARVFKQGPGLAKVTFPEGFTGWQIAARLQREGFTSADKLVPLMYPPNQKPPYEGTLFPNTYILPFNAPPKTLIQDLQKGFVATLQTLPHPFPKVDGKPLTPSELATLASLVEREAAGRKEMPMVAGVILNRLNKPMRLQVDAAIQYAFLLKGGGQGHKTRMLRADLKTPSPYNTYLHDGLPPGPICNPGKDALLAAAKPAQTDALFYVFSPKQKKSLFAKTYSEHLKNVRECAKETAELAKDKTKTPASAAT